MHFTIVRLAGPGLINLPIEGNQPTDPYICKGIDGLGPPEIDVTIARTPDQGGYFQNKVAQNKQVIVGVGLNPAWSTGQTPSDLREELYGLLTGAGGFPNQDRISIQLIEEDEEVARIYGYVSKMETVPFSKDPQVQITIECLSPYLTGPFPVTPDLETLAKDFPTFVNPGNGPSGFDMSITFTGTTAGWKLDNGAPEDSGYQKFMNFNFTFLTDDVLSFSTVAGKRFAKVIRGASEINMLAYLTSDSEWLQIYTGVYESETTWGTSSQDFDWTTFQFFPQFWGI